MEHACAFTGHRRIAPERLEHVKAEIRREVLEAVADGCTHFLCGMAEGADLIFASIIVELKAERDLILEAALPYLNRAAAYDRDFQRLLASCNIVGAHTPKPIPRAASWCAMNLWCKTLNG